MASLENIRCLDELELDSQRVFIRVDFDVPLDEKTGEIVEDERLQAALPTIRHAAEAGARVILGSHFGSPAGKPMAELSLEPIGSQLARLTGWEVYLPDDCIGEAPKKVANDLRAGQLCLLENLRFHPGEENDDEGFARQLASLCDVYVNEAFSLADRRHASLHALPRLVRERSCGLAMKKELSALGRITEHAERPYVAILGGASVTDQLALFEALSQRCDTICLGGAMGNTLLAAQGANLRSSNIEREYLAQGRTLLELARDRGPEILLPTDLVVAPTADGTEGKVVQASDIPEGQMALDVGPETVRVFSARIFRAKTVLYNGPLGRCENPAFCRGSHGVARALADCAGHTVVCGSDSAAAVRSAGRAVVDGIDLVSTGGQAASKLLEGRKLPGVEALRTTLR